ncbi:hypothetical protein F4778DRAFT_776266 [Xylariomycetidae sp. FL2044]|nr:hypothetical protein F4778DRAFT_776266 [Xylariomycetidae sp. FL2044]
MMASHPTVAAAANSNAQPTQPTCQNCSTSTTPLWRRDEMGAVLCNACGLFLKLHGRARPISLKTDVIKSRNRVKTMRPDMQMKKKQNLSAAASNMNGNNFQPHDVATAAALAAVRATQQKPTNGHVHGHATDSPISRTATPGVYDPHLAAFQAMDHFQSDGLPQYPLAGGSPGRVASPNGGGEPREDQQTPEQLIAANSSLKTRVSELDLINELYRGRLQQLEQDNQTADNYRHSAELHAKEAAQERAQREEIQRQLDESHRRENMLKRRLDEMEQEIQELKASQQQRENSEPERAAKKPRIEEPEPEAAAIMTEEIEVPTLEVTT